MIDLISFTVGFVFGIWTGFTLAAIAVVRADEKRRRP